MTKPVDVNLESNPSLTTKLANAFVSQRINKKKTKYYQLNIQIGKIVFTKHPLFIEEDTKAVELKKLFSEYVHISLMELIPFLMDRVEILTDECNKKKNDPNALPKEITFLEKSLEEAKRRLEEEKTTMNNMASVLYQKWEEIKDLRNKIPANTSVKLVVKEFPLYFLCLIL